MVDGVIDRDEVEAISEALHSLLNAAVAHERPPRERVRSIYEIASRGDGTQAGQKAADICDDPVGQSLRLGIEVLGERLDEIGGLGLMGEVCEAVLQRDPSSESQREDILDKRWNGIGHWMS
jgi:hypothetical protein